MIFATNRNLSNIIQDISRERCFIVPIQSDSTMHWSQNRISFIYIYGLESKREWVIGINHNDCQNLPISVLSDFFNNNNWIYQKKYLSAENANYEAQMAFWFNTNQRLDSKIEPSNVIRYYWNLYSDYYNVNDIIPIMRWLEYVRDIKDIFLATCGKDLQRFEHDSAFLSYNDYITQLAIIEQNGFYPEFTEYNPYTLTGRPSNHFNGINYAALNKLDGSRKRFTSRHNNNGILLEFDLTAFHVFLIYNLVGLPMPNNIYEILGKLYFKKDELSIDEIGKSKVRTFKELYGEISSDLVGVEPFKQINDFKKLAYIHYTHGELRTGIFKKPMPPNVEPRKLFNYFLQNLETEFNSLILKRFNTLTKNTKTKLVLYTYDSFCFDYCFEDGTELLQNLTNVLQQIPYRLKYGHNYDTMLTHS